MAIIKNTPFKKIQLGKNYSTMILNGFNTPPQGGFKLNDMRKALKIMDKLEAGEDDSEIEVSEEDIIIIKAAVDRMVWLVCDADIILFCDYIEKL